MRRKEENENTIIRTYKNKLMLTKVQRKKMDYLLEKHRKLYNHCMWEWYLSYNVFRDRDTGKSIMQPDRFSQKKDLTVFRKENPDIYKGINRNSLDETIIRVNESWSRYFSDLKKFKTGELNIKPGVPKFKDKGYFKSWSYTKPGNGFQIPEWKKGKKRIRIYVQELGSVRMWCNRKLEGSLGKGSIIKDAGNWYFCVTATLDSSSIFREGNKSVGIDVGVDYFLTGSDGLVIDNPRYFEKDLDQYRKLHCILSRKAKGSPGEKRALLVLQKKYKRIRNLRKEYLIKVVNELVSTYDFIAIEHFKVTPYIWDGKTKESSLSRKQRAALNRERRLAVKLSLSISDTSWYMFFNILKYKAEEAGVSLVKVNMKNNVNAQRKENPKKETSSVILNKALIGAKILLDANKLKSKKSDVEIIVKGANIRNFC